MKKNKQPTRKYNPDTKIRLHPEDNSYLTAGEFVRRIKENGIYGDKDVERTFEILIDSCKTGPHKQANKAKAILEDVGFRFPIIPELAKNRTDNPVLRHYQLRTGMLIREIERVKFWIDVYLYSHGVKLRQKRKYSEVFYYLFKRPLTLEEIQALPKKGFDSIPKLSLFFWACWIGVSSKTLSELYYSEEVQEEKKEIESLNNSFALTSREKGFLKGISSHI